MASGKVELCVFFVSAMQFTFITTWYTRPRKIGLLILLFATHKIVKKVAIILALKMNYEPSKFEMK